MEALGMATTHFEQPRHTFFRDFGQAGGGSDAIVFIEMINDIDRFGFARFRIE